MGNTGGLSFNHPFTDFTEPVVTEDEHKTVGVLYYFLALYHFQLKPFDLSCQCIKCST